MKRINEALQKEISEARDGYLKTAEIPNMPLKDFLSYLETGNRIDYEQKYFSRRRELAVLSLSLLEENDLRTKELLEQTIWEICNEYTWALPAHLPIIDKQFDLTTSATWIDLFAAETGQALAEIIELIGDKLSPFLRQRASQEIDRRIFTSFESRSWAWEQKENNWSAVIGGCIGMAALSLLADGPRRQQMIDRLDGSMQSYLKGFGEDGACVEGVSYWAYGFGYFIYYAQKLADESSDDRYLRLKKVQNIAAFPYYTMLTENNYVPFSDYSLPDLPSGLLSFCNDYFHVDTPEVKTASPLDFDPCYRFAQLYRNLIWTKNYQIPATSLSKTKYFPDAQWLVIRSASDNFVFAAKGGSNEESHNHLDIGHFVMGNLAELFLTDIGAGEYTRDYFNDNKRYDFFVNSALSHSLPIINGYSQVPGDVRAEGSFTEGEEADCFELSLENIYPEAAGVERFVRTFKIEPQKRRVDIFDKFAFTSSENQVVENFIAKVKPVVKAGKVLIKGTEICEINGNYQSLQIIEKEYDNHEGKKETAYLIQFISSSEQQTERVSTVQLKKNNL